MLSLTSNGATAIRRLIESAKPRREVSLRIVLAPAGEGTRQLALALAQPREDDLVVRDHGILLYFHHEVASRLEGKLLDAYVETGRVRLVVR
jgi:Fe-S cluster assembly iron-binding protein IscA